MRNVWTIAKREFSHYFTSPIAYAVAFAVFILLGLLYFFNVLQSSLSPSPSAPDIRATVSPMGFMLMLVIPALSMRLLAEEQRQGTIELLLTAPLRDWELVLGKWVGAFGFICVLLIATWVYPLITYLFTDQAGVDQRLLYSSYLGLAFLAGAMLSLGVLTSAITENQIVAFLLALGILLGLWFASTPARAFTSAESVISYLDFADHYYTNFVRGVVDTTDLVYYASVTIASLVIATQVVQARRWR